MEVFKWSIPSNAARSAVPGKLILETSDFKKMRNGNFKRMFKNISAKLRSQAAMRWRNYCFYR